MIDGLVYDEASRCYKNNEELDRMFIKHTQDHACAMLTIRNVPVNDILDWIGPPESYCVGEAMVTGWNKGEKVHLNYDPKESMITFDPEPHPITFE